MPNFSYYQWNEDLPDVNLDICTENLDLFFKTMFERQTIWKKRFIDKLPQPWTKDVILRDNKFTNVYRELDKNSQWQIKNIILDESLSIKNLLWKMMVFRFFNNINTFSFAKLTRGWGAGIPDYEKFNEDEFAEMIQEVRDCNENPFTQAYLINSMAAPGKSRDYCYTRVVMPSLHKSIPELLKVILSAKKPEEIISFLKTIPAVADFIAHEFYQDFTYVSRYTNRKFMKFDQNDFTNVGPGCSVGIRLIFPSLVTKDQKHGIYWLRDLAEESLASIGDFPYLNWNKEEKRYYISNDCNITLHQIEMWLCEFQKYWKMKIGKGKQRSKFIPKSKNVIN